MIRYSLIGAIFTTSLVCFEAMAAFTITDANFADDGPLGQRATSITVDGNAYTDLVGATASDTQASDGRFWEVGDTAPGTEDAALSGLYITDGLLNTSVGVKFQFGNSIGLDDILFVFEADASPRTPDDITLGVIGSSGQVIGDYTLTLSDIGGSGTTNRLYGTYTIDRESGSNISGGGVWGVAFTLAEFVGTTGDLSGATGLYLSVNTSGDLTAVGRVIPEPASLILFGLSGLIVLRRGRLAA